jgi:hypothetical protein
MVVCYSGSALDFVPTRRSTALYYLGFVFGAAYAFLLDSRELNSAGPDGDSSLFGAPRRVRAGRASQDP